MCICDDQLTLTVYKNENLTNEMTETDNYVIYKHSKRIVDENNLYYNPSSLAGFSDANMMMHHGVSDKTDYIDIGTASEDGNHFFGIGL